MKYHKVLLIAFLGVTVFTPVLALAQFYPFGGRILAVLPPIVFPVPLCSSVSIIVGPPMPGWFMLPPATAYQYYNFVTIGTWVLGIATFGAQVCFPIIAIGSAPGPGP